MAMYDRQSPPRSPALDGPPPASPAWNDKKDRYMSFHRVELEGLNLSLGCAERSPVTGDIDMKRMKKYPDYCIVDLYDRPHLPSALSDLRNDKYLFRPVPLTVRTWLYHALFEGGFIVPGEHEENQVIRYILAQKCIDAPTSSGLGSPLQSYIALSFGVCLVGDMIGVVITIFFLAFLRKLALWCNTPSYYWYSRLLTLPFRIAFLIVFMHFFSSGESFIQICGILLVIGAFAFDMIIGDLTFLVTFRLNCFYDIISCLGNRTYICYRHGAMGQEETFGERGRVEEEVSGMAVWERSHILIADIGDLIVELRPLSEQDWEVAMDRYYVQGPLPYICTRVFQEVQEEPGPDSFWLYDKQGKRGMSPSNSEAPSMNRPDVMIEDM